MNYADMSDAELDHAIAMGSMNAWSGADLEALRAEKARRAAARMAPPVEADDQAAQNDAAATPIVPDAEVKPRVIVPPQKDPRTQYRDDLVTAGWSEEQADRFTEQEAGKPHPFAFGVNPESERAAVGRAAERDARHSAQEAYWKDVYGHNDEPPMSTSFEMRTNGSAYGALPDFGGGETDMVDGVEVPTFDLGDGKRRYRLGDVKRAQEAAADERYADMVSKSAQDDLAKYGDKQMVRYTYGADENISGTEYVPPSALTAEQAKQQANLIARRGMESRQQRQNAALRNRLGLQRLQDDEATRRARYSEMARLAGGSSGLRGGPGGNMGTLAALQMLQGVDPADMDARTRNLMYAAPGGQLAAGVDAQNAQQAGRIAQQAVTAFLTNNPGATPQQQMAGVLQFQNAQSQQAGGIAEDAETLVGEYAYNQNMFNWLPRMIGLGNTPLNRSLLTVDEEEKAIRRLRAKHPHLTYEQALAHIAAAAANTTRQRDMAAPPQ